MRSRSTIIFLALLLGLITISAKMVSAQTPPDKPIAATRPKTKKAPAVSMQTEMTRMKQEPHHILAMSYLENMAIFVEALRAQVERTKTVDVEFSRAAGAEINRSYMRMDEHHRDHLATLSEATRTRLKAHIEQENKQHAQLKEQIAALEKDVEADKPDAQEVIAHTADLLLRLDTIAKLHGRMLKRN